MCWPFRPAPGLDPGDTTENKFPANAQRRRGPRLRRDKAWSGQAGQYLRRCRPCEACPCGGGGSRSMLPPTPAWAPAFAGTGLVGGDVWTRPGLITTHHRDRPLSERESRRWPETAEQAKEVLAAAAMVTPAFAGAGGGGRSRGRYLPQMGDRAREGGKCVPQDNLHLLTRSMPALAKARGGPPFGQPGGRRRHAVRIRRGLSRGGGAQ